MPCLLVCADLIPSICRALLRMPCSCPCGCMTLSWLRTASWTVLMSLVPCAMLLIKHQSHLSPRIAVNLSCIAGSATSNDVAGFIQPSPPVRKSNSAVLAMLCWCNCGNAAQRLIHTANAVPVMHHQGQPCIRDIYRSCSMREPCRLQNKGKFPSMTVIHILYIISAAYHLVC